MPIGFAAADQHGGALLAMGILGAYVKKLRTGHGTRVEASLLNAGLDLQTEPLTLYLSGGFDREKFRRNRNLATWFHEAPYGVYRCADCWLALSLNDPQKLAKALGSAPLAAIAGIDRHDERDRYAAVLADALKDRRFAELVPGFDAQAIWYQRVHDYDELPRRPADPPQPDVPRGAGAGRHRDPGEPSEPLRRRGAAAAPAGARDRRGYPRGAGRARLRGGRDRRSACARRGRGPSEGGSHMSEFYVSVGDQVSFAKTVGESDIYLFAGITGDFSGNHVNEEFMKRSVYGRRIAHGVLLVGFMSTCSTMMIAKASGTASGETPVSLGYDRIRFLGAVFIGDTVTVTYRIAEIDPARRRSRSEIEVRNQHGDLVAVAQHILKWTRNPS